MKFVLSVVLFLIPFLSFAQAVYNFQPVAPIARSDVFQFPSDFTFQYLIEAGQVLPDGSRVGARNDFAGYIPNGNSSTLGTLVLNSEDTPGGVSIYDVQYDPGTQKWDASNGSNVDFSVVGGTVRNCSGGLSPWGTFVTCEEKEGPDNNNDGFNDIGWAIEINPMTRQVMDYPGGLVGGDKIWGMGHFRHENVAFHPNQRTVYLGADAGIGYIFKYVANVGADLSAGSLYAYTGPKSGNGSWVFISCWPCGTDPNTTNAIAASVGATVFSGVEDVEYDPASNTVYAAVKNEGAVYRFTDNSPLMGGVVSGFDTYVGGLTTVYNVPTSAGPMPVTWGTGNDNLTIDNAGNLWVLQDGDGHYIWHVENGHTQANPKVKIFAVAPEKSELTGMTFTPDNKFMFLSVQHPDTANVSASQYGACGVRRFFQNDVTIVMAHESILNSNRTCQGFAYYQNQSHASGIYQVTTDIRSDSKVHMPMDVRYHAGNCILLDNNFEVELGAHFEARIIPCDLSR